MTHDELVRFAANTLGVELLDTYFVSGFDLTSPELFLKGLVECPFEVIVFKNRVTDDTPSHIQILDDARDKMAIKRFNEAHEIALLFWQCWAELEGGKG